MTVSFSDEFDPVHSRCAVRDARQALAQPMSDQVRRYYDALTTTYQAGFGDVFQGSRPESTEQLLQHIAQGARLQDGQSILDAGCGIGGPAVWMARQYRLHVEALTISDVQVTTARQRVAAEGLSQRVAIRRGDFHRLSDFYADSSFDRVLFLESICHAQDYRQVLQGAWRVLRPGGLLYIKDFYCQDFRHKPAQMAAREQDLVRLNEVYQLVLPDLPSLLDVLMETGFRPRYIREPEYDSVFGPWIEYERLAGRSWSPNLSHHDLIAAVELLMLKPG
jgi:ubiquinone/menaquinone biosynthesis C-methylase UbiE